MLYDLPNPNTYLSINFYCKYIFNYLLYKYLILMTRVNKCKSKPSRVKPFNDEATTE